VERPSWGRQNSPIACLVGYECPYRGFHRRVLQEEESRTPWGDLATFPLDPAAARQGQDHCHRGRCLQMVLSKERSAAAGMAGEFAAGWPEQGPGQSRCWPTASASAPQSRRDLRHPTPDLSQRLLSFVGRQPVPAESSLSPAETQPARESRKPREERSRSSICPPYALAQCPSQFYDSVGRFRWKFVRRNQTE